MISNQYLPPLPDELEISLFGAGYGEAIAMHIGDGQWILVDSYRQLSNDPDHLAYLKRLNVDVANAVQLIVVTHWHDDHIKGISDTYRVCTSADLVISSALSKNEFLTLISLEIPSGIKTSSGLTELKQVFKIYEERKLAGKKLRLATADKTVYKDNREVDDRNYVTSVSTLSPSDEAVLHALKSFATVLPKPGEPRSTLLQFRPNYSSVVLWVEVDERRILLGADLEETAKPGTGWTAILTDSKLLGRNASVFKVPHHGSGNAHNPEVWSQALSAAPYAILTPYNRGRKPLPAPDDRRRITNLTPHAYITATKKKRAKLKNRTVRRTLQETTRGVFVKEQPPAHVRLRCKLNDPGIEWQVHLFGSACSLNQLL